MEWNYFETIGIVGFLVLVIQLLVFRWESRSNSAWRGVRVPVTLRQVLLEWATYMLIIIVVSMLLQGPLHLTCSFC
jgi:hypothetical protein